MDSIDAAIRNGRTFTKNAELPAALAANKNGTSGRQQLDDKITVPRAAILAPIVRPERESPPLCRFCVFESIFDSLVFIVDRTVSCVSLRCARAHRNFRAV